MLPCSFYIAANPFFSSYLESDFFGKGIFLGLAFLSVITWVILWHKWLMTRRIRAYAVQFKKMFEEVKQKPLNLTIDHPAASTPHVVQQNPWVAMYRAFKKQTLEILNKNKLFGSAAENQVPSLSRADVDLIATHVRAEIAEQVRSMERNLFVLSTVVTLAPFLGLLGTVWGILVTFSGMQTHAVATSSQTVLGGLSLALTTTVLGLLVAIPALVGYSYLKAVMNQLSAEMDDFSTLMLAAVEFSYRRVEST